MTNSRVLGILLATLVAIECRRVQHQKRSTQDICDAMQINTNLIQCFCTQSHDDENVVQVADCYLTKNHTEIDHPAWHTFKDIKDVEKLTLTNRLDVPIKYIPTPALKHLKKIININIKYGDIKEIKGSAFSNLSSIRDIILSDDQIETLHRHAFSNHKHLSSITLDKNKITEINREVFVELPHLEKLYLTNNKITTIHDRAFIHLINLKQLELDKNKIFSLNSETFSGLKNLERLELSHNSLEVIGDNTFSTLTNLQYLNLDDNNIQMLDEKAFKGLANLKALSLSRNKLSALENVNLFLGLNSLISLSVKSNKMQTLKKEILKPVENNFLNRANSVFDFDDNEFPCECELDWLLELWNKTANTRLRISIENLKCNPNEDLTEKWKKQVELEKAADSSLKEDTPSANADYEYYDDSQLDGKLFYIDVRDLLNCTKKYYFNSVTEVPPKTLSENPKGKFEGTTLKLSQNTKDPHKTIKITNQGTLDLSLDEIETTNPTTQSINKIESFDKPSKEHYPVSSNMKTDDRQKTFTTSRLATVSAKPTANDNDDADMASDEALPPDAHRHSQRFSHDSTEAKPSNGNKNLSSAALIIPILAIYTLV